MGRVALVATAANALLALMLVGSLLRLLLLIASLRHDGDTSSSVAQRGLCSWHSRLSYGVFAISCFLSATRRDADVFVFALALFTATAEGEAEALATIAAISPGVGDGAETRLRAARLRQMPCLAPDAQRQSAGLVSVILIVVLTSVTDLLWGLRSEFQSGTEFWSGPSSRRAEACLVCVKFLLKLAFVGTSTRLRLLRPVVRLRLNDIQSSQGGGGALFASSVGLLCLACVSSALLTEPGAGVYESHGENHPGLSSDAVGLATGPAGMLSVLGCTVAVRSGGSSRAALLAVGTFVAFLADGLWLSLGPLAVDISEMAALLDGNISQSWLELPPASQNHAIMLLLQMVLLFCMCVAAFYHWFWLVHQHSRGSDLQGAIV